MIRISLLGLLAMAASSYALAENSAHTHYTEGKFREAADLAQSEPSPDSLAFAARATLAACLAESYDPSISDLKEAVRLADSALALDPEHSEARLQKAIALSLKARPLSTREALRTGYGEESRDLVMAVLEAEPDNPWAHGFMAVWHVEVRRRAGSIGSRIMGASLDRAEEHFKETQRFAPESLILKWQYARALAAHNPSSHRDKVLLILNDIVRAEANEPLEVVMKVRAKILLDAFETNSNKQIRALAAEML